MAKGRRRIKKHYGDAAVTENYIYFSGHLYK